MMNETVEQLLDEVSALRIDYALLKEKASKREEDLAKAKHAVDRLTELLKLYNTAHHPVIKKLLAQLHENINSLSSTQ